MNIDKIKKHLIDEIKTYFIEIFDNSRLHNYSKQGITHLKIVIVSNIFMNKSLISRHRLIFNILNKIITKKIYSITLHTYTLIEWSAKKYQNINSSQCLQKQKKYSF